MFGKCLFFAIYLFGKCQFPTFYLFGKFYFVIFTAEIQDFTRHSANGLPLGSEADNSYRKILFFDCGLMLRLLGITIGDTTLLTTQILTATAADLVNKGTVAELVAGLEMLHYMEPNLRHELFYWVRMSKNSLAEIDYLLPSHLNILPIEVKAGNQGEMKSLWSFMREKHITEAVRHVNIFPLYAVSQIIRSTTSKPQE